MNEKILVVDDEVKYRNLISLFLKSEGMTVLLAENGKEALEAFHTQAPDLVILDVMLPDISGFDVCKEIRKSSDVPILFLTAMGDEDYHIIGYRAGADDYIPKPFKSAVLALKIRRILQRTKKIPETSTGEAWITFDEDAYTCTVNGEEVPLTSKEYLTLREFINNRGRVLTRDYLLRVIWGYDYLGDSRAVDTLVAKLRKKLGPAGNQIKTVINAGYKLEEAP